MDRAEMVRYNPDMEGILDSTHLGRIASHFYIQHETIVQFNEALREGMDYGHILDMLSKANEFSQLRVSSACDWRVYCCHVFLFPVSRRRD